MTLDLGGRVRLGPDAVYVERIDYAVDPAKAEAFAAAASPLPARAARRVADARPGGHPPQARRAGRAVPRLRDRGGVGGRAARPREPDRDRVAGSHRGAGDRGSRRRRCCRRSEQRRPPAQRRARRRPRPRCRPPRWSTCAASAASTTPRAAAARRGAAGRSRAQASAMRTASAGSSTPMPPSERPSVTATIASADSSGRTSKRACFSSCDTAQRSCPRKTCLRGRGSSSLISPSHRGEEEVAVADRRRHEQVRRRCARAPGRASCAASTRAGVRGQDRVVGIRRGRAASPGTSGPPDARAGDPVLDVGVPQLRDRRPRPPDAPVAVRHRDQGAGAGARRARRPRSGRRAERFAAPPREIATASRSSPASPTSPNVVWSWPRAGRRPSLAPSGSAAGFGEAQTPRPDARRSGAPAGCVRAPRACSRGTRCRPDRRPRPGPPCRCAGTPPGSGRLRRPARRARARADGASGTSTTPWPARRARSRRGRTGRCGGRSDRCRGPARARELVSRRRRFVRSRRSGASGAASGGVRRSRAPSITAGEGDERRCARC